MGGFGREMLMAKWSCHPYPSHFPYKLFWPGRNDLADKWTYACEEWLKSRCQTLSQYGLTWLGWRAPLHILLPKSLQMKIFLSRGQFFERQFGNFFLNQQFLFQQAGFLQIRKFLICCPYFTVCLGQPINPLFQFSSRLGQICRICILLERLVPAVFHQPSPVG